MSGLYNLVNGYNPSCILILPMLGRSSSEYPRFRDCFVSTENGKEYIDVYTRVGGGNRNCGYGEEKLYEDENFVITFDDDFDNTYGTYRFNVPEKWKKDFDLIVKGKLSEVSDEYIAEVKKYYTEEFVDKIFKKGSENAKETC